jgi:catechol 2,3-dioxygenase
MDLPVSTLDPPFRVTRSSHVVLTVRDLARSKAFYTEIVGLILTAEDDTTLYFRGVEEACHHSLVLRRGSAPGCARVGLRMFTDSDLDAAKAIFESWGCPAAWCDIPFQGRTLHVTDPVGAPLEFCATMPVMPRMIVKFTSHRGGCALRLDHYQILTPNVRKACEFYMAAGFRLSEYIAPKAPMIFAAFSFSARAIHTISFSSTGQGPDCTTLRICRRRSGISSMPAIVPAN